MCLSQPGPVEAIGEELWTRVLGARHKSHAGAKSFRQLRVLRDVGVERVVGLHCKVESGPSLGSF